MSTNIVHILTIAGKAAVEAETKCEQLLSRRAESHAKSRRDHDWRQVDRRAIDRLAKRLLAAAHQLPVVFYAQYLDGWSVACSQFHLLNFPDKSLRMLTGDTSTLAFFPSKFAANLTAQIQKRRRTKLYRRQTEDRYFLDHMDEALRAGAWLNAPFLVVAIPVLLGGSRSDEEVKASLDEPLGRNTAIQPTKTVSFRVPLP